MISFMLIITIFIAAYGVASNAILYPNQPLDQKLLVDVFYDSWWSVLQQFNREDALGKLSKIPYSPLNKKNEVVDLRLSALSAEYYVQKQFITAQCSLTIYNYLSFQTLFSQIS